MSDLMISKDILFSRNLDRAFSQLLKSGGRLFLNSCISNQMKLKLGSKVCSVNFEPPTESPLNECSLRTIMAISCENDIFMAPFYKQSLPKIAQ